MLSFGCLCVLLGLGYWLRRKMVLLQKLYLPASVIAGLLGLLLLQTLDVSPAVTAGWTAAFRSVPVRSFRRSTSR